MNFALFTYLFQVLWRISTNVLFPKTPYSGVSRFQVHSLPGSPSLPTSWAGRLHVPGAPKGNDIFFWLFEAEDRKYDDNLISE